MPPKTNQFKQGQAPPAKQSNTNNKSATSAAVQTVTDAAAASSSSAANAPMHMLLRTANKIMLQTVFPSKSLPPTSTATGTAPSASVTSTIPTSTTAQPSSTSIINPTTTELFAGVDCSECEAILSRNGEFAVVATASDVRIVFLKDILAWSESNTSPAAATTTAKNSNSPAVEFITLAEEKVCHLLLSPLETFLVTYRMRDPKRPSEGNMSVYNLQTIFENHEAKKTKKSGTASSSTTTSPAPVLKCVQGAWQALVWTPNEEYCVRFAKGLLMLHEGAIGTGDDSLEDGPEGEEGAAAAASSSSASVSGPRCKLELQLPQNKEPVFETAPIVMPAEPIPHTDKIPALDQLAKALPPLFVLFKPHNKNQLATLNVFRLPMFREPQFQIQLQRAEGAQLEWNRNATHICVTTKQEPERGDNSYYAKTTLVLLNLRDRKDTVVKFPGVATIGAGASYEAVHDVKWSPTRDEFIVIHGTMPRNKATLYNDKGQALFQFGEAPRNLSFWSPNGAMFVIGGTGSLVGEFQFYNREGLESKAVAAVTQQRTITGRPTSAAAAAPAAELGGKLGSFNEKSSEQTWSPDSRHILCATVFGKLRIDNKLFIFKHNGERCGEVKYKTEEGSLYQATWVPRPAGHYGPARTPSPTVAAAVAPKPALFKARGAGNAAISAALSRAPAPTATAAKPAGLLPGENPIAPKQKGRR